MDDYMTWIRRVVFAIIAAVVFMPAGALIYKMRSDEIMRDRFEKQEIELVRFKYIESRVREKLQGYIEEANLDAEKQLVLQEIMKYRKLPIDGK